MNRKRLERLVRAQQRLEKAQKAEVALAHSQLRDAMKCEEEILAQQRARKAALCEERTWNQAELLTGVELLAAGANAYSVAQNTRTECAKGLELEQQKYRDINQRTRTFESFAERLEAREAKRLAKHEQRALDEIAARRKAQHEG